jgi:derlin-1
MAQQNLQADLANWYYSIPRVTRFLFSSTILLTITSHFGLISPYRLILIPAAITRFQIWRLFTNFFLHRLDMNFLFYLYFMYNYSLRLETGEFVGRTGDLVHFLGCTGLITTTVGMLLGYGALSESLLLSIVYLWSKRNREQIVTFYFGLQFKAEYLPWVMLGFEFFATGGLPMTGLLGCGAAHAYHYLRDERSMGWMATPRWMHVSVLRVMYA